MKTPVAHSIVGPSGGRPKKLGPKVEEVSKPEKAEMTIKALRKGKQNGC